LTPKAVEVETPTFSTVSPEPLNVRFRVAVMPVSEMPPLRVRTLPLTMPFVIVLLTVVFVCTHALAMVRE
jgi:hypothetical protein